MRTRPTITPEAAMQHMPEAVTPPRWYTAIAVLALLWMLVGAAAWFMDLMLDAAALAAMSEGQRSLFEARPQWIFVVYGVATLSGLLGAVALLMRDPRAVPALALSLVAVTVQFGYTFLVMDAIGRIGAAAAVPFPATIFLIGAALLRFAIESSRRGWLTHRPAAPATMATR
jgi:hypothetical protein